MDFKLFPECNEARQAKGGAVVKAGEKDLFVRYLDDMSASTAKILINRHLNDSVMEKFDLKDLKITGRYCTATIVEEDGKLIAEVLIDKQTGKIQRVLKRSKYFE